MDTPNIFYSIKSPMLKASLDSPFEWLRGVHYCKLLSPSRAIEWLLVILKNSLLILKVNFSF